MHRHRQSLPCTVGLTHTLVRTIALPDLIPLTTKEKDAAAQIPAGVW